MARIFIDGFESGGNDLWDAEANATVISSAGLDMDGDYCLDLNSNLEYVEKDITADDEMYFAFLYRPTLTTSNGIIIFKNGSTLLGYLKRDPDPNNVLKAHSSLFNVLATGTADLDADTTYLIEIYYKVADSGGRFVVKVDGVTDINFTGDTKPSADTQFNKVVLGYHATATGYANAYFDNFIMDDASWIGDTKIQKILPIGGGSSTIWNPSVGANWQCVDERPASDVDYVSTNAVDQVDTYQAADMAGAVSTVKCVQIQSRTESDGAPTPTNLKLVARCTGVDYLSGNKSVPADPKSLWNLWENNPADSLAWEEADVNAMEIGIKSAA